VRDGEVLGEGWHEQYGGPHAEVNALRGRGDATGATLYVSLEPVLPHGKQPPCTDAISPRRQPRRRRLRRPDREGLRPRPGILRDEGVDVDVADGELAARRGCSTRPSASTAAPAGRGCSSSRR
jgi:diaminohydroxyphosphoribosylaminopyrimidine deaminase/5-amino-6-(5-phosphoribosylamino)uracil reductase